MTPLPLSYSRASVFENCPLRFKAESLDKKRGPASIPMLKGAFLHDLADAYTKHLAATSQASDFSKWDALFEEMWLRRDQKLPEFVREECLSLGQTLRGAIVIVHERHIGSEIEVALTVDWRPTTWLAKDVFWRAKIDRLDLAEDGRAVITDYKTGHSMEAPGKSMQLRSYAMDVAALMPEIKQFEAVLYYPAFDRSRTADLGEDDIETARGWVMGISSQVEQFRRDGLWPATPGAGCRDCPVFDECPEKGKAAPDRAPQTIAEAEDALGRLVMLDLERGKLKDQLMFWIATNGPVSANGMVAQMSPKNVKSFDTVKLVAILEAHRLKALDFLKGDSKALAKVCKKDDKLAGEVEAVTTVKTTTEFKLKRGGEEDEDQ